MYNLYMEHGHGHSKIQKSEVKYRISVKKLICLILLLQSDIGYQAQSDIVHHILIDWVPTSYAKDYSICNDLDEKTDAETLS
jgi:hypothetical protein